MRFSSPALAVLVAAAAALVGCGKTAPQPSSASGTVSSPRAPGVLAVATKNTTRIGAADPVLTASAVARAVYPGLTATTRPQAVVLVDEHNWMASLASSALAGAPLQAPLLYSEGNTLPRATEQALAQLRPAGANTLGGTQVIEVGTATPLPAAYHASAVATGTEPATVAAALEGLLSAIHGGQPRSVIVLPAEAAQAYQMPAGGLAAESGSPILLATAHGIPQPTLAVLSRLHRPGIFVIDAAAVGAHTLAELARFGTVAEVSQGSAATVTAAARATGPSGASAAAPAPAPAQGQSPAENAIDVARYSNGTFGWGVKEPGHGLVFANYARPLDAPASALLSASGDYGPLLLLESPASLPTPLGRYLSDIQPAYSSAPQYQPVHGSYNHGWLIGGEDAISGLAQAEIDALLEIAPTQTPEPAAEASPE